jgi:PAS domain-containing protein
MKRHHVRALSAHASLNQLLRNAEARVATIQTAAPPPFHSVLLTVRQRFERITGWKFEILGDISGVETFATGSGIREIARLRRAYGRGRWRKRKGIARVRLADGSVHTAEVHWYEAAGIGRKEIKIKDLL